MAFEASCPHGQAPPEIGGSGKTRTFKTSQPTCFQDKLLIQPDRFQILETC